MAVQGMQWPAVAQGPSASTDSYNRGGYKENSSSSSSSSSGQRDKVYVQNIPITMQQDSVEALFGKCGHVVDVKLLAPKDGRETVAGFIKFATEGAAEEAIDKMSGCVLGEGPPLRVMWPNSNRNNTQSDGRHGGSDRGSNQGFNRPNNYGNDSRRRQDRPMQSPFGMSSNGPVNHQQSSPFGANNPSNNNSYSQNSDKKSFMSILGRGENRNTGSSVAPGGLQSYGDNKPQGGHPPLAPLKTSPNYHNSVSQQNSYQNHQPGGGFQEPMSGQQQYNYQKQPHSNGYQQPPAPQQGQHFQEKAPRNYYQQPPAPQQHYNYQEQPSSDGNQQSQYHYQEQPSSDGYQQSQYHYQEQPSIDSYQQPPAPQEQNFQEQHSSDGYQQPQYHYQEQPSADSYQQPPAPQQGQHYPEQLSSDGYQHPPTPGQYHYQEQPSVQSFPTASNQEYQHNSSQQYQSWGDSNTNNTRQNNSNFDRTNDGPFGSTAANQSSWQPRSSDGQRSQGRDRTCHNCKEPGHFSRECPNPRVQGGQTCHKCGEVGHFSRECPNQSGPSGDQLCHKCGEAGHFARECSNAPSRGGGGSSCHKCGEEGHFARECPNAPSRGGGGGGGGGGSSCHKCGEEGHFARECSNAPNRDGTCHKCGEEGHFARECTVVNSNDSSRPAPVTYIPQELPEDMDALFRDIPHSGINFDKYDNIPVKATGHQGQDAPPPVNTFEEINFGSQTKTNIRRAGFVKPTPVQKYAFPIALAGQDLMACAQTGSGKTIAYLLPTLTSIINSGLPTATQSPLVICMAPTRELVVQIYKEAKKFADGTPVKVAVAYGGVSVAYQAGQIERGCHFLAATPGRLQDFVTREKVYLDGIKHLILDEADRMLDLGFGPAIRKLVTQCNMTPKEYRQTLMFSATFPNEIQLLAADFLKEDYFFLAVGCVGGTNLDIDQHVMRVNGSDKRNKLFDILNESGKDRTLVFVELKRVADFLACLLSENNFPTTSISSDRSQQEREAALKDFRNGRANILVATSVAARGLDIPDVKHVVNYDLPQDIDEYVHRIGRTGRIGNKGKATSFFEQGRDEKLARSMVKVLSDAFQEVPSWLEQAAEDAVGSSYGPAGGRFTSRDHREGGGRGRRRDDITNGMSNLNIQSEPSSNFGSKSYRQDTHSPSYTNTNMQNGPVDNHPPQGSHQERAPQGVARGGQGDSDDDWD